MAVARPKYLSPKWPLVLSVPAPSTWLRGIETALSVLQATGKPVWACLGTSGLKAVILPPEVKTVVIAADADEAGEKAAQDSPWTQPPY
jgi:hypothetical protein